MSSVPQEHEVCPPVEPEVAAEIEASHDGEKTSGSYGQILKSTALIGGTSVLNIMVGVARSKAIALILGPSGVGLNGIYGSITGMAELIAGMGISSSGVRQIAEAAGSGDQVRVAKTAAKRRQRRRQDRDVGNEAAVARGRERGHGKARSTNAQRRREVRGQARREGGARSGAFRARHARQAQQAQRN